MAMCARSPTRATGSSWQIVEALRKADFLTGEVEEVPAEGTLAPDSYEVRDGDDRGALLADMEERQALRLAEAWANRDENLPIATPEEALILASIIEKETGVPDERGTVACGRASFAPARRGTPTSSTGCLRRPSRTRGLRASRRRSTPKRPTSSISLPMARAGTLSRARSTSTTRMSHDGGRSRRTAKLNDLLTMAYAWPKQPKR